MIYLPRSVQNELRERTRSFYEDVIRSIEVRPDDALLLEYNAKLQAIDSRLMMVRARETVVPGVPMKPGYYHLLCSGAERGVPISITVIEGANGEFTEPTSRVFEKLAAGDMRERRNMERFALHEAGERAAAEREQQTVREERRQHLSELVKAHTETSVSLTDATPWRQNQAGHKHGGKR